MTEATNEWGAHAATPPWTVSPAEPERSGPRGESVKTPPASFGERLYVHLYDLARSQVRGERRHSRDVAHESWIRLARAGLERQREAANGPRRARNVRLEESLEVWEAAPATVRRVLREDLQRRRLERGRDGQSVEPDDLAARADELEELVLHDLFEALARRDPRAWRIATLRCEGLSIAETALRVEASTATVKRAWRKARAYFLRRMGLGVPDDPGEADEDDPQRDSEP